MAKVIKATPEESQQARHRAAIISRDIFAARLDAKQIRDNAEQQAQEILSAAQQKAQAIVEQADQEAPALRETAKQEGYKEGHSEGVSQLTEAVAKASVRAQELESQLVPQIKDLALAIVRKILGKNLELHPEEVVSIIKQALAEKARQRREIVLRVHPEDLEIVRLHRSALLEVLNRCKEIGIQEDPDVQRHGVVIETDAGLIDAQLDTQLAVFERVLKSAL